LAHERQAAGVINTLPFTCMPGTIVTALLKRVREDCHGIPILSMIFTGQQNLTNRIRLEAFMHQARCFRDAQR
jgi:predicted nucleotide-binding protein (sugar kinase/HSP70/actin superfamily)